VPTGEYGVNRLSGQEAETASAVTKRDQFCEGRVDAGWVSA
jgi:hypothetical protein